MIEKEDGTSPSSDEQLAKDIRDRLKSDGDSMSPEMKKILEESLSRLEKKPKSMGDEIAEGIVKGMNPLKEAINAAFVGKTVKDSVSKKEPEPIKPVVPDSPIFQRAKELRILEEYYYILTIPVNRLLEKLVTKELSLGDETEKWTQAVDLRIEFLQKEGGLMAEVASMLKEAQTMYFLGVWRKADEDENQQLSNGSLDINHLSIFWGGAQKGLNDNSGMKAYARFKDNPLFKPVIKKLYEAAERRMSERPENPKTPKSRWYASGDNWSNGSDLLPQCHKDLYEEFIDDDKKIPNPDKDLAYIEVINSFKTKEGGVGGRKDIIDFFTNIAIYECCLRDLRTKVAVIEHGYKRSAIKHYYGVHKGKDGLTPQIFLAQMSYKIGKNKDRGLFASALGWINFPDDLKLPNGYKFGSSQESRFSERDNIINFFVGHVFGSEEAEREYDHLKWSPENMWDCMPQIEDFLEWQKYDYKNDRLEISNLPAAHYDQAWDALGQIYEKASTCWVKDRSKEFREMSDSDLINTMSEEIGSLGTQAARALAMITPCPDEKKKIAMLESIRAAISQYIIYLLAQLNLDKHGLVGKASVANLDYMRMYKSTTDAIFDFLDKNGSLQKWYKSPIKSKEGKENKKGEIRLSDLLIDVVKNPAFKKKAMVFKKESVIAYNTAIAYLQGTNILRMTTEQLSRSPQWNYIQKSNRSVHE